MLDQIGLHPLCLGIEAKAQAELEAEIEAVVEQLDEQQSLKGVGLK